ncbi:MAG TPA: hypothetical protein V6D18_09360 [Thermosynechococcaceae cyanobacterium]|jgi:hypothetical protein
MTSYSSIAHAADVSPDDYLVVGLATCFVKQDNEVQEVLVMEPIPSAALEAIVKGIPTSYKLGVATTLGVMVQDAGPQHLADFPEDAQFCDEFADRAIAAARTYKARPVAQTLIPVGTNRSDFNYSIDRKRVLNSQRLIRTEDNVKQHEYTHKVL